MVTPSTPPGGQQGPLRIDVVMKTEDEAPIAGAARPPKAPLPITTAASASPTSNPAVATAVATQGMFSALRRALPMILGVSGLAGILAQSKILTSVASTSAQILGAMVDTLLMPFLPVLVLILDKLTSVLSWLQKEPEKPTTIEELEKGPGARLFRGVLTAPRPMDSDIQMMMNAGMTYEQAHKAAYGVGPPKPFILEDIPSPWDITKTLFGGNPLDIKKRIEELYSRPTQEETINAPKTIQMLMTVNTNIYGTTDPSRYAEELHRIILSENFKDSMAQALEDTMP